MLKIVALSASFLLAVFVFLAVLERGGAIRNLGGHEPSSLKAEETRPPLLQAPPRPRLPQPSPSAQRPSSPRKEEPTARDDSARIYGWVDEDGTTNFSDRPIDQRAKVVRVSRNTNSPIVAEQNLRKATEVKSAPVSRRQTNYSAAPAVKTKSFQTSRIARGTFVTSQGLKIVAISKHSGNYLSFEGRVSKGAPCETMTLYGYMKNNNGLIVRQSAVASDVGEVSRLFQSYPMRVSDLKEGWDLYRVDAYCASN